MTSKQRAYLRISWHGLFRIGKSRSTRVTKEIDEALEARELIKISVLNNCADDQEKH